MNDRKVTLQDVTYYWLNLIGHTIRSNVITPASSNKKSTLVIMAYTCWWQSSQGNLFSQEPKQPRCEIMQPQRAAKARVIDDASTLRKRKCT